MRRAHGFSLMEVLAALALLTIVLLGVYSGISTATRIVRSGDNAIQRMDEIRSAQNFLRAELAQALVVPFDQTDDGDPIVFSGDSKALRFVAPLPGYLSRLGPQLQTVSLVDDGASGYRLEVRLALLPPDGSDPQPLGEPEVLLRGIRKGSFSYRGMDEQNRPGDWSDAWSDGRRTPSLVRVELEVDGNVAFPMLVAPVRIDASASRNGFNVGRLPHGPVRR
ncbi:prepilin-type N-terminal cleavage/methylation domain-containing protein [Luteibacter sp. SG786]|uniref:prepilin-type N-terminal cleavage/methylation domain-containing protein n=1 Tax=Luteibacter sp. SG786 TaxID=2587130 RepID=UPI001424583F|nr:prepilin-type N-terminal cleavage/methylation domain-containing protein [Luteibacter sp. SG786]NII56053.1 general secretion pathway protein J [Luteibacter sp. SG786]